MPQAGFSLAALAVIAAVAFAPFPAMPGPVAKAADGDEETPPSQVAISPIFSQLVMFSMPGNFLAVAENVTEDRYIREAVINGESVDAWTQMITVTGAKGLAQAEGATAKAFVESIASGFQNACPQTFTLKPLGSSTISEYEAYAAIAGCGTVASSPSGHGESALLIALKGDDDMYTIQWAERSPGSAEAPTFADDTWTSRREQLDPIRLCAIVDGEAAPYPSCLNANE